jgi:hypothetical protein
VNRGARKTITRIGPPLRRVVWTLVSIRGGTLVRMEQSGFRPDQEPAYKGTNSGWKKFISGLERVVAGGNSVAIEKET